MFLTISIVDTRSSFDAPQQGEVIAGQTAHCLLRRLGRLVEHSDTENIIYIYLFIFSNVIDLVQQIIQFVMRTEPKALYRMVIIVQICVSFIFQT